MDQIQCDSSGLAVVGDTFLAAYVTATEIRGIRFSRAAGILDAGAGFIIAKDLGNVVEVVGTSDGQRYVIAWREKHSPGGLIRIVRVAGDGRVLDARPIDVMQIDDEAQFSVAADTSAILVAYTHYEASGAVSTRAVIVPEELR